MTLKGPLTNSSGTLLGSETSIRPAGGCVTGMTISSHSDLLVVREVSLQAVFGLIGASPRRPAVNPRSPQAGLSLSQTFANSTDLRSSCLIVIEHKQP